MEIDLDAKKFIIIYFFVGVDRNWSWGETNSGPKGRKGRPKAESMSGLRGDWAVSPLRSEPHPTS